MRMEDKVWKLFRENTTNFIKLITKEMKFWYLFNKNLWNYIRHLAALRTYIIYILSTRTHGVYIYNIYVCVLYIHIWQNLKWEYIQWTKDWNSVYCDICSVYIFYIHVTKLWIISSTSIFILLKASDAHGNIGTSVSEWRSPLENSSMSKIGGNILQRHLTSLQS